MKNLIIRLSEISKQLSEIAAELASPTNRAGIIAEREIVEIGTIKWRRGQGEFVYPNGKICTLRRQTEVILETLFRRAGYYVTEGDLLTAMVGCGNYVSSTRSEIATLRNRLGDQKDKKLIQASKGRGYRLVVKP